jgi:hypothetical protein|tara:strand:- start:50 stop:313 length:264 start_codon:yes stop_codon:yes gene_type:complete
MSVYLPLDQELDVSHIEEMFLKNKYFKKLCMEYLDMDDSWYLSNMVAGLDRKDIELLWDESLELRYEARDYIIDNWDKSRYTNPNME